MAKVEEKDKSGKFDLYAKTENKFGPGYRKRMLFLDDRTKRIHAALIKYKDEYDVIIVTNVKECLRYMVKFDYDVISLDHDLNGCDFADSTGKDSGLEVVKYFAERGWPPEKPKPQFWIHSSNIFAAHQMATVLMEGGFKVSSKPFIYPINLPQGLL
ncbi:MAG: hypothetical protein QGD96_09830 [Anaerolineae bacterium]|nr:hypothetical protein [Anaerolineae bacterium]